MADLEQFDVAMDRYWKRKRWHLVRVGSGLAMPVICAYLGAVVAAKPAEGLVLGGGIGVAAAMVVYGVMTWLHRVGWL